MEAERQPNSQQRDVRECKRQQLHSGDHDEHLIPADSDRQREHRADERERWRPQGDSNPVTAVKADEMDVSIGRSAKGSA
jgi:hypothetical protein